MIDNNTLIIRIFWQLQVGYSLISRMLWKLLHYIFDIIYYLGHVGVIIKRRIFGQFLVVGAEKNVELSRLVFGPL